MASTDNSNQTKYDHWGGNYVAEPFDYRLDGTGTTKITVVYDTEVIRSINFEHVFPANQPGPKLLVGNGTANATYKSATIEIDWNKKEQYLTKISGTHRSFENQHVIGSLRFQTRDGRESEIFGSEEGEPFEFSEAGHVFVGFHGRHGKFVDALGVYTRPFEDVFGKESEWFGRDEKTITKIDEFVPKDGNGITKITVSHGKDGINALVIKTSDEEKTYPTGYGGTRGENNTTFDIKSPFEFLTKISGTFTNQGIETLRFHTNDKAREANNVTFGSTTPTGKPIVYSEQNDDVAIVGFKIGHWKTIQALKVITKKISLGEPVQRGPWGGNYGASYYEYFLKNSTRINISHSPGVIHSITINGNRFGGSGGTPLSQDIVLDGGESLKNISGTHGTFDSQYVIQSLLFETNRSTYGPFPSPATGTAFPPPQNKPADDSLIIVGFHGHSGKYLDAIGVFTEKEEEARDIGPWGGKGGKPWDHGFKLGAIKKIKVYIGKDVVRGIEVHYRGDDNQISQQKLRGGKGFEGEPKEVELEDDEYVTGITGFSEILDDSYDTHVVRSLKFYTNKRSYPSFGIELGDLFGSENFKGKVVGFFGRSGDYLDAIGVHVDYDQL